MMRRFLIAIALSLACASSALAVLPEEMLPDQRLEARAREISKEVRCQVCQNQNIDDSNAPLAADLRRIVRERLTAGDSDQQVLNYLVQRYGDYVLMRPPVRPSTWPLWFGSAVVLVIAAGAILVILRRRRTSPNAVPPLAADEERRLAELLERKS
jgi:cytochrome c-type biogenesis protein CcmH